MQQCLSAVLNEAGTGSCKRSPFRKKGGIARLILLNQTTVRLEVIVWFESNDYRSSFTNCSWIEFTFRSLSSRNSDANPRRGRFVVLIWLPNLADWVLGMLVYKLTCNIPWGVWLGIAQCGFTFDSQSKGLEPKINNMWNVDIFCGARPVLTGRSKLVLTLPRKYIFWLPWAPGKLWSLFLNEHKNLFFSRLINAIYIFSHRIKANNKRRNWIAADWTMSTFTY